MKDKYANFSELAMHNVCGRDYRVHVVPRPGSTAIIAPHGGKIEPGTSEVALALAGDSLSFYAFEGLRRSRNGELHITSTNFDEPECLRLLAASPRAVGIHGKGPDRNRVVLLGGRDTLAVNRLKLSLGKYHFEVKMAPTRLQGCSEKNICNRCMSGLGVQLELSRGLRDYLRGEGEVLTEFAATVRDAVLDAAGS